jgi:hypothetical protein
VADFEPTTAAEAAVFSAFTVLVNQRQELSITADQLLTVCRAVPDYALRLLAVSRAQLTHTAGPYRAQIARMVMTVEWELRGPTEYMKENHLGVSDESQFILNRLTNHPEEFTRDDLQALLKQFGRAEHPLRLAALNVLAQHVVTFAERVTAEPPGLSRDIESLKKSIREYGFSPELNEVLEKVDQELEKSADAFDQLATMKHIRSFFEKLHESIAKALQAAKPMVGNGTPLDKCQQAIDYLERKNVITEKIKNLGRCLYGILSDGDFGVHALKASRDYTRLCRNMVVEYAVTLFFELDRRLAEPGNN